MNQAHKSAFDQYKNEMRDAMRAATLVAVLGVLCLVLAIGGGFWPAALAALLDTLTIIELGRRFDGNATLAGYADPHGVLARNARDALARAAGARAHYDLCTGQQRPLEIVRGVLS